MRRYPATLAILLFLALPAMAQPPILPDFSPLPPQPPPATSQKLGGQELFVIRSQAPCIVLTSPPGLVKMTMVAGPLSIRAIFVGGSGTWETKTFTEKNIYLLEAIAKGSCELIVIPSNAASDKDIIRRALDVDPGTPPEPGPGPTPEPTDPLWPSLKAAYAQETDKTKTAALASLYKMAADIAPTTTDATIDAFFTRVMAARKQTVGDALPKVRAVIDAELNKTLHVPTGTVLDTNLRAQCQVQFARMATLVDALGKQK